MSRWTRAFGFGAASSQRPRRKPPVSSALRLESYPYPYPDGWYRLASSKSLRRGQTRYLECLGRALVLWRTADADDVFAMEAFCPHLGANLAHGRVCGNRIECPFHEWQFTGDGRVASVPYSDAAPPRAAAVSFPVEEIYGQIFMYHICGEGADEIQYPVPRVPEIDEGSLVFRGDYDAGRVGAHVIELIENAADYAHFGVLHKRMNLPFTQIPIPGTKLEYTALLDINDDRDKHSVQLNVETGLNFRDRRIGPARNHTRVTFAGAGSIVNFRISVPGVGEVEIIQTQTPVAPLEQQVNFCWFAEPTMPRLAAWYVAGSWISQWRQDVKIWEAKVFKQPPMLCRDDGPVMRLRRRYSQYFPGATAESSRIPNAAADALVQAGEEETFTPSYLVHARKPD